MNRPLLLAALLSACAAAPRRAAAPAAPTAARPEAFHVERVPPAEVLATWREASPEARARLEDAIVTSLDREAAVVAHPSNGLISTAAPERAWAIFEAVSPDTRPRLARSLLAWLLQRAWGMSQARPLIQGAVRALGPSAWDAIVDACDRAEAPYGCPSFMLYTDDATHEALVERLLARARGAFEAARDRLASAAHPDARDPVMGRVATLVGSLLALDRPEPVHRFLLGVLADASMPPRLRIEALERMNRTDLPFVEPALLAVARSPGDVEVRVAATGLLGRMFEQVSAAQLAALYDGTARDASAAPVRRAIGVAFVRRERLDAMARLIAWMRRRDATRAGYDEADAWAHALAWTHPSTLAALLQHGTAEGRALAILTWSWGPADDAVTARIEALRGDRATLAGSGWTGHEVSTVGALATWALAHRERDPMIRLDGCCVEQ
ncbi:MAG: hypothetical protein U0326_05725 [Polyangiales bacterium]